jgi:hypothetical protein
VDDSTRTAERAVDAHLRGEVASEVRGGVGDCEATQDSQSRNSRDLEQHDEEVLAFTVCFRNGR